MHLPKGFGQHPEISADSFPYANLIIACHVRNFC